MQNKTELVTLSDDQLDAVAGGAPLFDVSLIKIDLGSILLGLLGSPAQSNPNTNTNENGGGLLGWLGLK